MELPPLERRLLRVLLVLGVIAVSLWLAWMVLGALAVVADVVLVFVLAWALAYLIHPLVRLLRDRAGIPQTISVALVYAALIGLIAVALGLLAPVLATQVASFVERAPQLGEQMGEQVRGLDRSLARAGIDVDLAGLYASLPERAATLLAERFADAFGFVGGLLTAMVQATLVLILSFFMLIDGSRLWRGLVALLPPALASEAQLFRHSADRSLGGFLRGQLFLGLLYGVLTWILFAIVGLPFAVLLAVVSGALMVIPFFGAIAAVFPPLLVALPGGLQLTLVTLAGVIVLQNIVVNVVAPRVLARTVGLHPLFVLLAILLGARLAGFWGVFLALPVAGVMNVFFQYFVQLAQGRRERTEAALMLEAEPVVPEAAPGPSAGQTEAPERIAKTP